MAYDKPTYNNITLLGGIYHVTSFKNAHSILSQEYFEAFKAKQKLYDKELTTKLDAPNVVFFTASYYNSEKPIISPYPQCSDDCLDQKPVKRITMNIKNLNPIPEKYKVYFISWTKSQKYQSFTQILFLFVNKHETDTDIIDWCDKNIKDKEYDIVGETWSRESIRRHLGESWCNYESKPDGSIPKPLYVDNESLYTLDMNMADPDAKYVVNLAFAENIGLEFEHQKISEDKVTHICHNCFDCKVHGQKYNTNSFIH